MFEEQGGRHSIVTVDEMTDVDMFSALKFLRPEINGRYSQMFSRTEPQLRDHYRPFLTGEREIPRSWVTGEAAPGEAVYTRDAVKAKRTSTRQETSARQEQEQGGATMANATNVPDFLDGFRQWVEAIAANGVSEDRVREIVAEAVEAAMANVKPQVTTIQVQGCEPVEIKGRAHPKLQEILDVLMVGEVPYLVGEPGTGKSHTAELLAEILGVDRVVTIQCTQQLLESRIAGFRDATGQVVRTDVRDAWEHGGIILIDEIDKANPNTLAFFNNALSNGWMTFPDGRVRRHDKCFVIAGANTYGRGANAEFVGSTKLDASTLDRFHMIEFDRDEEIERELVMAYAPTQGEAWLRTLATVRANIERHGLKVLCTMRAAIGGAKLVERGWSHEKVIRGRVLKGVSEDVAKKVLAGV
ncbi:MAG UNVERIFIED_CONTAM: AAA family ATPase [Thermobifida fusca]